MQKLTKLLHWLDKHALKLLVIGYIFLIPLWPKLPIQMVQYTYIAIRLEDFYVALMTIVYAIQFFQRKVEVPKLFMYLIGAYWLSVFASFLYGHYILETIPQIKIGFLHAFRRIEYMIIFFVAYSTIKSKDDLLFYLRLVFTVVAIVCLYAYGQRFLGWPAVQTMNPEYAKGYILILDQWSRVSSTFAGHYDLSAYLVLLMPVLVGMYIYTKHKKYLLLYIFTIATIVLAGSRASFGAYLGSMVLYLLFIRKWKLLVLTVVATVIFLPISENLTNRITRTFQPTRIYVNQQTGEVLVPKDIEPDDLPPGDFAAGKLTNGKSKSGGLKGLLPVPDDSKINPELEAEAREQIRKQIIYESTMSGKMLSPEEIEKMVEFTFLQKIPQNTYLLDISASTRLQVEWPRAVTAFLKNPILGSGPSSITEATDGDYFRWMGELGLLGTLLFLSILGLLLKRSWALGRKLKSDRSFLYYGFIFGLIGLLANALLIDVFEASKVAYTFWLVAGIFMGEIQLHETHHDEKA